MNNVVLKYFYPTKDGNLMIFDAISDGVEPVLLPYEGVPFSPEVFATSVNYGEPAEHSVCVGTIKNDEGENIDVLIYRDGDWTPVDQDPGLDKYHICIDKGVVYRNVEIAGGLRNKYVLGLAEKVKNITLADAYDGTVLLKGVFANESSIESVTFPFSVKEIPQEAFYNCSSLKEVNVRYSISAIGKNAFESCRSLSTINYDGTMEQWKSINKYHGSSSWDAWNYRTGDYVVHCSDGDILKKDDN